MPTTTAKPCRALIASSWLPNGLLKTLISTSLAIGDQSAKPSQRSGNHPELQPEPFP
jgi:hypothetical protein